MARASLFNAYIDWEHDNLDYDVGIAFGNIQNNIPHVLEMIGGEMIEDLQKHIQKDVYDAYTPTSYPRRKDHPEFGTSLIDIKNFDTRVNDDTLEFDYHPTGFHSGKMKDVLNYDPHYKASRASAENPLKPHPVHGDALIERIETGKGYDWRLKDADFPQRPFWSNFVDEEMNGGIIRHFNRIVPQINMTDGKCDYKFTRGGYSDLTRDGGDATSFDENIIDDYDDLPF